MNKIILIIFTLIPLLLFGNGSSENQYSSDIKVYNNSAAIDELGDVIASFKIVRSSSNGVIKIEIKSNSPGVTYYVNYDENDNNLTSLESSATLVTKGDLSNINIGIRDFKNFSYEGGLQRVKKSPEIITCNYNDRKWLINM